VDVLVSPSQITVFRDECERKWALKSIVKLNSEPHPSALLGTEVDEEQLQPYLTKGQTFDFTRKSGEIAATAVPFLPAPLTPGLEVQKHFTMPSPSWRTHAFGYQGFIDLWHPDSSVMPGMDGGVPLVSDFKTTSNFRWAKTEETLKKDPQAVVYGTYAVHATQATAVDLAWIYMRTRETPKAIRRHLRVLRNDVGEEFKRIDEVAVRMVEKRKIIEPTIEAALTLEPNLESCEDFGGCPYRVHCQTAITSLPSLEDIDMGIIGSSFAERLKKQREASGAPQVETKTPAADEVKINPPESELVTKTDKDPKGADIAAYTQVDEPKAKRATKAKGDAVTNIVNTSDPKIVEALKAAAKAFLEALG
jgi:hypothetical protein